MKKRASWRRSNGRQAAPPARRMEKFLLTPLLRLIAKGTQLITSFLNKAKGEKVCGQAVRKNVLNVALVCPRNEWIAAPSLSMWWFSQAGLNIFVSQPRQCWRPSVTPCAASNASSCGSSSASRSLAVLLYIALRSGRSRCWHLRPASRTLTWALCHRFEWAWPRAASRSLRAAEKAAAAGQRDGSTRGGLKLS